MVRTLDDPLLIGRGVCIKNGISAVKDLAQDPLYHFLTERYSPEPRLSLMLQASLVAGSKKHLYRPSKR